MSGFSPKFEKTAEDGSQLVVCIDGHDAWFLERPEDRESGAYPLGGFQSADAAKRWGDHHFPGGEWTTSSSGH